MLAEFFLFSRNTEVENKTKKQYHIHQGGWERMLTPNGLQINGLNETHLINNSCSYSCFNPKRQYKFHLR